MLVFLRTFCLSLITSLRKHKIHMRLLVAFLLISLVPVMVIGIFAYHTYTHSINNKVKSACQQSIELLNNNLSTQLGVFSNYLGAISVSDAIQYGISQVNDNGNVNSNIVNKINETIITIPFQSAFLKNIRVVTNKRKIIYDLGYDDISTLQYNELLDRIELSSPKDSLQYIKTYRGIDKIAIGRKIYNLRHISSELGYIMLYIDESLIGNSIFTDVSFGDASNFMLLDQFGNVVSSQKKVWLGTNVNHEIFFKKMLDAKLSNNNYLEANVSGEQYHIMFTYNDIYDLYLVALIPQSYITQDSKAINSLLIVVAIMLISLSLLITFVVYRSVMLPINNMIYACNTTDENEIDLKINDQSPDELGFLARTIDNMVGELNILIQRSINDEKHMRELELQSLHYQINPHFLFNTLNTLKWVAKLNKIAPVSNGIEALSSLLQSTLISKNEMIHFSDELANLKNYCAIQHLRYAGCFEINYEISDNVEDWLVPRFILQPLVENAILHGQKDKDDLLKITIKAYIDNDSLIINIIDTGKGFELKQVRNELSDKFTGIGLSNVDERLKLHYGKQHGLSITSTPYVGTTCTLKIPRNTIR